MQPTEYDDSGCNKSESSLRGNFDLSSVRAEMEKVMLDFAIQRDADKTTVIKQFENFCGLAILSDKYVINNDGDGVINAMEELRHLLVKDGDVRSCLLYGAIAMGGLQRLVEIGEHKRGVKYCRDFIIPLNCEEESEHHYYTILLMMILRCTKYLGDDSFEDHIFFKLVCRMQELKGVSCFQDCLTENSEWVIIHLVKHSHRFVLRHAKELVDMFVSPSRISRHSTTLSTLRFMRHIIPQMYCQVDSQISCVIESVVSHIEFTLSSLTQGGLEKHQIQDLTAVVRQFRKAVSSLPASTQSAIAGRMIDLVFGFNVESSGHPENCLCVLANGGNEIDVRTLLKELVDSVYNLLSGGTVPIGASDLVTLEKFAVCTAEKCGSKHILSYCAAVALEIFFVCGGKAACDHETLVRLLFSTSVSNGWVDVATVCRALLGLVLMGLNVEDTTTYEELGKLTKMFVTLEKDDGLLASLFQMQRVTTSAVLFSLGLEMRRHSKTIDDTTFDAVATTPILEMLGLVVSHTDQLLASSCGGVDVHSIVETLRESDCDVVSPFEAADCTVSNARSSYALACGALLAFLSENGKLFAELISLDSPFVELYYSRVYTAITSAIARFSLEPEYEATVLSHIENRFIRARRNHNPRTLAVLEQLVSCSRLVSGVPFITLSRVDSLFRSQSTIGHILFYYSGVAFCCYEQFVNTCVGFTDEFGRFPRLVIVPEFAYVDCLPLLNSFYQIMVETGEDFWLWNRVVRFLENYCGICPAIPELFVFGLQKTKSGIEGLEDTGNYAVFEASKAIYLYLTSRIAGVVERNDYMSAFSVGLLRWAKEQQWDAICMVGEEGMYPGFVESFDGMCSSILSKLQLIPDCLGRE